VRELLTPAEGVVDVCRRRGDESGPGGIRQTPALLLPRMTPGHPPMLDVVEAHLITGSEREREADGSLGDYVAGCENHFLLADGYSALAAIVCGADPNRFAPGPSVTFDDTPRSRAVAMFADRSVLG